MLTISQLSVSYGEAVAIRDVNVQVDDGQIVTIIGSNGAGKTTLVNTVAGILKPREGEVLLDGKVLTKVSAHKVSDLGVVIVPEGRRLFTKLSVFENLQMGAYPLRARKDAKQTLEWVYEVFPRLAERRRQMAGTLSGGEQQMVAIGRALMAKPKILLLDEPSLGLAPIIVTGIFEVIQKINAEAGVTILLVEQNANKALSVANYAYVLQEGHIVKDGTPEVLKADNSIQKAYLGI